MIEKSELNGGDVRSLVARAKMKNYRQAMVSQYGIE
jgi:hypothetical protein